MNVKKFLSLLLCMAAVLTIIVFEPAVVQAVEIWNGGTEAPVQGAGTSGSPYQINRAEELAWFAGQVNGGSTGVYAVLTADIALNDTSDWENWETNAPPNIWTPIGTGTSQFTGSFDGNNHTISGIYIGSGNMPGLFGCVGTGGSIQNIRVTESYISGSADAYGLSRAGGICGRNNGGSITGCYNYGTVVGSGNFVGGICGDNSGTVTGCYNYASAQGAQSVGGICGMTVSGGTVTGCGNTGSITGTKYVGGVCGSLSAATEPRAKILDSFNTGTVQGTTSGGICGFNLQGSITGCYLLNTLSAVGDNYQGSVEATGKSAAAFASGEVAYLLGALFGQMLPADETPAARSADGGNAVFKLTYLNGEVEHAVQYYNSGNTVFAAHIPIPTATEGEYFWGWDNLPGTMPDSDVTATAVFGAAAAPAITTTSLEKAVAGSIYLAPIQAEGSRPITYEVTSGTLPDGLSLDPDTGEITGIPTTGGTYTFTVQVENTSGYDTQELSITVETAPVIITTSLPAGILGVPYGAEIEAEGIPPAAFTVSAGNLPGGLSLDAATGTISGTPTAVDTYTFTIKAESTSGYDTRELSITVNKAEPTIMTVFLPFGVLGASYSAEIEAEGKTPITFTVSAGGLPAGLGLNAVTGVISGTPTAAGTSTFTVQVENDAGEDSRELSIEITDEMQGSGTAGDPYQIRTAEQLIWFAGEVNGGRQSIHAVLLADIVLNDTGGWENWATTPPANTWTPIGTSVATRFIGSFNGNNHTISGVYIKSSGDYQGLFGYVGANTTIQNLGLTESYIGGKSYVGGICGCSLTSRIINCSVSATVTGSGNYVGGVCGYNNINCAIQNCDNTGTITGPGYTGGISGINSGTITGCRNGGTINSNGASLGFGGVCGGNYTGGSIINSYNTGEVYIPNNNNVGGVCGYNPAALTNVYNTGTVTGNSNVGKVCGFVTGSLTNCYFLGTTGGIGHNLGSGTAAGKSADAFTSGEVAYLLGASFGQTLGAEDTPVFRSPDNSNAVYKLIYMNGTEEHAVQYYNSGDSVSAAGISTPVGMDGVFSRWADLPDIMPANDLTVTAEFTTPTAVTLISAIADGASGTTTSSKIELVFDTDITGLQVSDITITDITGSAVRGILNGSGTTWSIALVSVITEGEVAVEVAAPEGYTILGTPKTVMVYKLIPVIDAAISPDTRDFDIYSPADISTAITWNSARSVSDVVYNSNSLTVGTDYFVSGDTLTITQDYLTTRSSGSLVLTIVFDAGSPAALTINITDSTPPCINPGMATYDLAGPAGISTTITWNSARSVADVVYNSSSLVLNTDYTVNSDVLNIKEAYLSAQGFSENATAEFEITFDTDFKTILTVTIVNNYTPSGDADLGDLRVGGSTVSGFAPSDEEYAVELPYGTLPGSAAALVGATANDPLAQIRITQASALPGSATVKVTAEDGTTKTYTVNFTLGAAPGTAPTITTTFLPGGTVGTSYNAALAVMGDTPITWGIDSGNLPDGLTLDPDTGIIGGTPAVDGTFNFTIKATNTAGSAAKEFSIVIATVSTDKTLLSVVAPPAITDVANGTAKTAADLGLPGTVTLITDDGNVSGDVTWDIALSSYNPSLTTEQTFTVDGTVTLPSGIVNTNGVSLDVTISVTVNGAAAVTLQSITVTTAPTKTTYNVGETLDLTGLHVTGIYSDNSIAPLTITRAHISGFDSSIPADDQLITITYEGKTAIFTVDIVAKPVNPTIDSITAVDDIEVPYGTSETEAIEELPEETVITDSGGAIHNVELEWRIGNYDGNTAGDYEATGTFTLPAGVDQTNPVTELKVTTTVTVLERGGEARLAGLTATGITLSPEFASSKTNYSDRVSYSRSSTVVTATPLDSKATVEINGIAGNSREIELDAGSNTISIIVTAEDGITRKTYTLTITRAPKSSSGSDNDDDNGDSDNNQGTNTQTNVIEMNKETSTAPGRQSGEIFTVPGGAAAQIAAIKARGEISVQFQIDSSPTALAEIAIPLNILDGAGLNVSIVTPQAILELPSALVGALAQAGQDLSLIVTRGGEVHPPQGTTVLGTPTIINTGMAGTTQVTIPLTGINFPSDPKEKETFLAGLMVFVLHSNGEEQIIRGKIIYDEAGNPVGISFPVDKFSTFAVIKIDKQIVILTIGQATAGINGINSSLDAVPYIDQTTGRTLAPLRFIGEALGAKVEWLSAAKQVRITAGEKEIILSLSAREALINGEKKPLDCAPVIVPPGRIFLPLRFVGEALGAQVAYDNTTKQIRITGK
ncbi:MAG: putative Ig domain-containing protein [Peptococcaceae bacterium]